MQENQGLHKWLLGHCEKPSNRLDSQDMVLRFDVNSTAISIINVSTSIRINLNGVNWSEIELAIPFVPNRDPPDTPQQSELGEVSCIIIHQNEVVTNSSSIWADIWIKDLISISKTSYGSSMEHMQVSVATEREIPAQTRIPPPL
ncbi:hypothetical protein TNCV_3849501 [Trichonephila clavipes]|nr:hypothetical protein TNCV_3849501 [Trichonephila clavipes]